MQCKWCSDNVLINDTATTDIYTDWHTLARHDALPIWHTGPRLRDEAVTAGHPGGPPFRPGTDAGGGVHHRSEEHTSELQSLTRISSAVFCSKTQIVSSILYQPHISRSPHYSPLTYATILAHILFTQPPQPQSLQ